MLITYGAVIASRCVPPPKHPCAVPVWRATGYAKRRDVRSRERAATILPAIKAQALERLSIHVCIPLQGSAGT